MIDISLKHAASIVRPLDEEVSLNYGYYDELSSLNLSIKDEAEYAIKKWLVPSYLNPENYRETEHGLFLRKEACRFKITLNHPFGAAWLPGIDIAGDVYVKDVCARRKYQSDLMKFQLLLWEHRFPNESFKTADLENYRNRIDSGFKDFPDYSEKWGEPEYAAWPWKDLVAWIQDDN
ncbi:hypothetical protein [Comamonas terrigena]|uniref:hypothetical protein n=1 Tax=Comamonas terrigena TaxID=32013 RepID=UPI0028AFB4AE|nr:hypothetical protein [Comamonas terrigena]